MNENEIKYIKDIYSKSKMKSEPYCCPRCGYQTIQKQNMRYHLKIMKRICPTAIRDLVLTDEIKETVLRERLYHPPVNPSITQTINNIHMMNNFIASMDPISKLKHITEHHNIELVDFETRVEKLYKRDVHRFITDGFRRDVVYNKEHFMDMVSDITSSGSEISDMNIVYDSNTDHVHFAVGEEWELRRSQPAILFLVETLVLYNLSFYEIYLIRKLVSGRCVQLEECLTMYYHFIGCFNIQPYVFEKNDSMVLFNESDIGYSDTSDKSDIEAHRIVDKYNSMYLRIRNTLTDADRRSASKEVIDILKSNHKLNISQLNKHILEVLRVDEGFKTRMISNL